MVIKDGESHTLSTCDLYNQGRKANINYKITVSLFCAKIERKNLRISLIIIMSTRHNIYE